VQALSLLVAAAVLATADTRVATLAVVNARVWTGNPSQPWASAIAVTGERILAVGSDEQILELVVPSTRVIDARGWTLTPGFIDSHVHMLQFEPAHASPPSLFLRFTRGKAAVAAKIAAYAKVLPTGAWIYGHDWNAESTWQGGPPPSASWLDQVAPDHPVWLTSQSGDIGIANTRALRKAGMAQSNPTGLIRGGPMWRVEEALIESTRDRDEARIQAATDRLLRAGVTSIHHNNSWHQLILFRRMKAGGRLRMRIYACPSFPGELRLKEFIDEHGRGDEWLHWGGLKAYGRIDADRYYRWISNASRGALQVMTHVGSEGELRTLLQIYDRVQKEQRLQDPRFRIEHAHEMPPDLIARMAELGAIVSWQPPLLAHFDQRTAAGQAPPRNLFDCRALLDSGVRIAFGTDGNLWRSMVTPIESIQLALQRPGPDGRRITLDEALRAYTRDAAYAEFADHEKGTLEPGKLADFVLLDRDLSRTPVHRFSEVQVKLTVIGGRVAFE
jgi:predicted amidohydrolase YtcJ